VKTPTGLSSDETRVAALTTDSHETTARAFLPAHGPAGTVMPWRELATNAGVPLTAELRWSATHADAAPLNYGRAAFAVGGQTPRGAGAALPLYSGTRATSSAMSGCASNRRRWIASISSATAGSGLSVTSKETNLSTSGSP